MGNGQTEARAVIETIGNLKLRAEFYGIIQVQLVPAAGVGEDDRRALFEDLSAENYAKMRAWKTR